ncbi:hypothetical protein GK011_14330 [Erwinia sp. J316]|uniref:Secreted protein n=1 Tax=Erwinia sorbitola TaxID=2681984 RepID=A0ABW9RDJ1_9GAMM|nr:hypothetical protein [Erwinia sorbitola]
MLFLLLLACLRPETTEKDATPSVTGGRERFANYSDTQTRHTPPEAVVVVVAVRKS